MERETATIVLDHVGKCLAGTKKRPFVVGICGPQGSGKSWLVARLEAELANAGLRTCAVSLDDFYLTRDERQELARTVHPLLAVRGVPGTHDLTLAQATLDSLSRNGETRLPRFDKSIDDHAPPSRWNTVLSPADIVLFEGWCVGAVAQEPDALGSPVNTLEADEDADGRWRRYVNTMLAGPYQELFARLDTLVLLQPPGFDVVVGWRTQQEETLRATLAARGEPTGHLMDAQGVTRFVSHYERLTRHILAEMPARADLVVRLDRNRRPL